MGFERRGDENCMDHINLHQREKINIIGGPPGLTILSGLKRKKPVTRSLGENGEDDDSDTEYSLRKRRRQKGKQKVYLRTLSEAGSASERDPTSPRKSSVSGDSSDHFSSVLRQFDPQGAAVEV